MTRPKYGHKSKIVCISATYITLAWMGLPLTNAMVFCFGRVIGREVKVSEAKSIPQSTQASLSIGTHLIMVWLCCGQASIYSL